MVAYILGRQLGEVTLASDGETLGRCRYAPELSLPPGIKVDDYYADPEPFRRAVAEVLENEVIKAVPAALAGGIAEEIATGKFDLQANAYDFHQASELAGLVVKSEEELEAYLDDAAKTARAILEANWPAVEALAEVLQRQRLPGEKAARVIEKALASIS